MMPKVALCATDGIGGTIVEQEDVLDLLATHERVQFAMQISATAMFASRRNEG